MSEVISKTFQYGKHRFVAGLYWQPFYSKKDIKTLAKEVNASFSVEIRSTSSHRPSIVGFATTDINNELKNKAHLSLASIFLNFIRDYDDQSVNLDEYDIVGVVQLSDQYYQLIMISEGIIIKDIAGDQAFIRQEYDAALSMLKRTVKLVPNTSWSSDADAVLINLDLLFATKNLKQHTLKPLSVSAKQLLILLLILAIPFSGYMYYDHYKQIERQKLIAQAKAKQLKQEAEKTQIISTPWKEAPAAMSVWSACLDTFQKVNLYPTGWHYTAQGCNHAGVTISWDRYTGLISELLQVHPSAVVDVDGNKAVDNLAHANQLQPSNNDVSVEKLLTKAAAINRLNDDGQRFGLQVKIAAEKEKDLPGQPAKQSSVNVYQALNFEITTTLIPVHEVLNLLPKQGLVIDHFASKESGKWLIKGVLYVQS